MTDPVEPGSPERDADVAAAELALGLIEGEERAAALRRVLAEPGFAREVERWRRHFASLFVIIPDQAPAEDLGERIVARLDGRAQTRAGMWKPFAYASSLAAAGLLGVLIVRPDPAAPPPPVTIERPAPLVAAVMVDGKDQPMVAVYDAAQAKVRVKGSMDIPSGRSVQLWAIVEGDPTPHPLGVFKRAGEGVMMADAPSQTPMTAGTTLAISVEPLGGSPTGLPTGPVIGSGMLTQV